MPTPPFLSRNRRVNDFYLNVWETKCHCSPFEVLRKTPFFFCSVIGRVRVRRLFISPPLSSSSHPQQCDTDDTRCRLLLQPAPRWSGISKQSLLKTSDLMSPTNKGSLCGVPIPHPASQHCQSETRCQALLWGERFNCFCHACTSSFFSFSFIIPETGKMKPLFACLMILDITRLSKEKAQMIINIANKVLIYSAIGSWLPFQYLPI